MGKRSIAYSFKYMPGLIFKLDRNIGEGAVGRNYFAPPGAYADHRSSNIAPRWKQTQVQKRRAGLRASCARGVLSGPLGHPLPAFASPPSCARRFSTGAALPTLLCAAPSGPQSRPCAQTPDQGWSVPAPRPSGHSDGERNGYDRLAAGRSNLRAVGGYWRLLSRFRQI